MRILSGLSILATVMSLSTAHAFNEWANSVVGASSRCAGEGATSNEIKFRCQEIDEVASLHIGGVTTHPDGSTEYRGTIRILLNDKSSFVFVTNSSLSRLIVTTTWSGGGGAEVYVKTGSREGISAAASMRMLLESIIKNGSHLNSTDTAEFLRTQQLPRGY